MTEARNNDRHGRLSAALRENLKRRKAQLRGRAGHGQAPASEGPKDGAASEAGKQEVPEKRT